MLDETSTESIISFPVDYSTVSTSTFNSSTIRPKQSINGEGPIIMFYDSDFATGTSSDYIYVSCYLALAIFVVFLFDFMRHLLTKEKKLL